MYTAEYVREGDYAIFDPDGDLICTVRSKEEAESLLSHLNRTAY